MLQDHPLFKGKCDERDERGHFDLHPGMYRKCSKTTGKTRELWYGVLVWELGEAFDREVHLTADART